MAGVGQPAWVDPVAEGVGDCVGDDHAPEGHIAGVDPLGEGNYWGEGATTLEWTLPSPPPFHQFETLPKID